MVVVGLKSSGLFIGIKTNKDKRWLHHLQSQNPSLIRGDQAKCKRYAKKKNIFTTPEVYQVDPRDKLLITRHPASKALQLSVSAGLSIHQTIYILV